MFSTNLVTHSSRMLHTCFPLNCFQTQKVRLTCYQSHHTENLFWKFVTLVSCGLSWDHVCTFRGLFKPSRVKDASSVNKMTPNSYGCACIPFWAHSNTSKTTSVTQCLMNTTRRNPSVLRLLYSSTAATALPLQNPYTKWMSQYSTWENTKGIFAALNK